MTHDEFKEALNNYAKEKDNKLGGVLEQIEKSTMEDLLYIQHYIAQTIVFFNVNRIINVQKAQNDEQKPV